MRGLGNGPFFDFQKNGLFCRAGIFAEFIGFGFSGIEEDQEKHGTCSDGPGKDREDPAQPAGTDLIVLLDQLVTGGIQTEQIGDIDHRQTVGSPLPPP